MKNSRLLELLSALDKSEFIRLEEFLISPFLNKNKQIISFYYFLSALNIHSDYGDINKEEIFEYVYPEQKFNVDKYLKLSSDFVKAIEKFLLYEFRDKRIDYNKRIILEISGKRNLKKTFDKYLKELNSSVKKEFNKDLDFYLTEYETKIEELLFRLNEKKFNLENALLKINDTVDTMITHYKLELMIKLFHISSAKRNKIWLEDDVIEFVEKRKEYFEKTQPMVYMRMIVLKMFAHNDDEAYSEIKNFIGQNESKLNNENLIYLYDKLLTFCALNGSSKFKTEEFTLIKKLEKKNILFTESEEIDYKYFLKLIDASLNENEAGFAEKLLKNYSRRINPDLREDTIHFAQTSVHIFKGEFREALESAYQVSAVNDFFYLSSKSMLLIIYFELKIDKSVYYIIDSMKNFLARKKGRKEINTESYSNFLKYLRKMLAFKSKDKLNKNEAGVLLEELASEDNVANKEWLERKMNSLKPGSL